MAKSGLTSAVVIGNGAVGGALVNLLDHRLYNIRRVITKQTRILLRHTAADRRNGRRSPAMIPQDVRTILIAVPDDHIAEVVKWLELEQDIGWTKIVVLHTSGALSSDVFNELRHRGARCGSIHPLQSFPRSLPLKKRRELMKNIAWGIEGDAGAVREARTMARFLGGRALILKAEEKALYHAACVFASNYAVTLIAMAGEIAKASGIAGREFRKAIRPLIESSMRNALERSPLEALTGPIERGDENTIRKHLKALRRALPRLVEAYSSLGSQSVELAMRKRSITKEKAAALYRLFYTS